MAGYVQTFLVTVLIDLQQSTCKSVAFKTQNFILKPSDFTCLVPVQPNGKRPQAALY